MKKFGLFFAVFAFSTRVFAQTSDDSATYTCSLYYWITNGSILGGGGNVNIENTVIFDLSYPSNNTNKQYYSFTENKRHFFTGLYHYDGKVIPEVKVFKEGASTWQGLISVFEGEYLRFEPKLHISSFVNNKEKIEHYKLNCVKKTAP